MFGLVYTLRGSSTLAALEYERHHKDIARGDIDGCPCLLVSRIKQPWLLSAEGFGTSVTRINIPTLTSPRLNIGVSLPCSSRPLHLHILLLHILLLLHGRLHILLLNIHTFL